MQSSCKNHLACETATPEQRAAALPWLICLAAFKCGGLLVVFVLMLLYLTVTGFPFAVFLIGFSTYLLGSCLIEPLCFWNLNRIEGASQSRIIYDSLVRLFVVSCFVALITSSLWSSS